MGEKHTPGPWTVEDPLGPESLWIVEAGKEPHEWRCIAMVCQDDPINDRDPVAPILEAEQQANARLIAAAPETAAERDRLRELNAELVAERDALTARVEDMSDNQMHMLVQINGLATRVAELKAAAAERDALMAALKSIAEPLVGTPIGDPWAFYADLQQVARAALAGQPAPADIIDVAVMQPDDDTPGLWIGFRTVADRDRAMKLFRAPAAVDERDAAHG